MTRIPTAGLNWMEAGRKVHAMVEMARKIAKVESNTYTYTMKESWNNPEVWVVSFGSSAEANAVESALAGVVEEGLW